MDEKGIKIAFLDDGINSYFVPQNISFINLQADGSFISEACPVNGITHGTACFTEFKNYVKTAYELISIKILNEKNRTGKINSLLAALNWCGLNGVQIINMSIGTRQFADMAKLYDMVKQLSSSGVIIIAACSNQNTLTFPACFPNVIGVRHYQNEKLRDSFTFIDKPFDNIDIITCANDISLANGEGQTVSFKASNSIAAPFITARVCGYLADGCAGLNAVKQRLKLYSIKTGVSYGFSFYKKLLLDWKEIDVPVVVILNDNASYAAVKMTELVRNFIQNGYHAVGLSPCVYKIEQFQQDKGISLTDILNLYFNFTKSDIIILHINSKDFMQSELNNLIDILITEQANNSLLNERFKETVLLDIDNGITNIYNEIIRLLCPQIEKDECIC